MNVEKRTKTVGSGRQKGTLNKPKAPIIIVVADIEQAAKLISGRQFFIPNSQEKTPC